MRKRAGASPNAEAATLRRYLKEIAQYPALDHKAARDGPELGDLEHLPHLGLAR
jgi:hypothetical protein